MNKIDRFWSHEAQNIRCVREADYDRDVNAWQERALTAEAKQAQQGERCQGENCGTTTGQHSRECIREAARDQGWIPTEEDFKGYAKPEQPAAVDRDAWVTIAAKSLIDELTKLGQCVVAVKDLESLQARAAFAPDAVVMPARMTTIPEGKTISYAAGYEDALDAVARLNRHPPAPAIPEGYVLVPSDPTPKMIDATWHHPIDQSGGIESQNTRNERIYRAMLAAAPQPTEG